ncbi:GLPGLI family protein [Ichthyenterobacterium sp. W332]|uniref:GLPGLI family protein n=1 Tax=Microcosmobacter mediterraneus TaxID=3075607 RepID=A0ABU2YLH5_9FLAO|nr:GLPGLI family protein [Ichthyenterobacterium sp. W332]MDT0559009.1 GLPGLI family protein [Ichthyenterobacterium sp. W332]
MKRILVSALILIIASVNAQDFQGVATYKSKRKIDIKLDSTQVNSEMHNQMVEMMKKQFEKTYKLTFNKEESIYKEEEKLSAPQPAGMQMVMINTGGSDLLYKNTKDKRFTNQNESFSKLFLIKDSLTTYDWKLSSETKNIGEYTCYKATFSGEVEVIESSISINGDNEDEEEREPKMETRITTAWYTPQIPVNNGPGNYHGLPGLILEVNDGSETVICSRIVMNPIDKVKITEPTKGKEITQEAYDKVMEKKMKEMEERYRPRRGDSDGQSIEIRIGG